MPQEFGGHQHRTSHIALDIYPWCIHQYLEWIEKSSQSGHNVITDHTKSDPHLMQYSAAVLTTRAHKCVVLINQETGVNYLTRLTNLHDPEEGDLALHDLVAANFLHEILKHLVVVRAGQLPLQLKSGVEQERRKHRSLVWACRL